MGKLLSKPVAFLLSLGVLLSFGAAQLEDFLVLHFPSHQSILHRGIGLTLVFAQLIFVIRPMFRHFGIGANGPLDKDTSQ